MNGRGGRCRKEDRKSPGSESQISPRRRGDAERAKRGHRQNRVSRSSSVRDRKPVSRELTRTHANQENSGGRSTRVGAHQENKLSSLKAPRCRAAWLDRRDCARLQNQISPRRRGRRHIRPNVANSSFPSIAAEPVSAIIVPLNEINANLQVLSIFEFSAQRISEDIHREGDGRRLAQHQRPITDQLYLKRSLQGASATIS